MATQGLRTNYHIRVIHPVNGTVLIDPLYHLGDSTFTKLALQPGWEASAAIGTFTVNLYPPASTQYKIYKADYDKLLYGQRVEFYAISGDGQGAQGNPAYASTINSISFAYDALTIAGNDSLGLALEEHSELNEHFAGTTDQLLRYALKAYTLIFADGDSATLPWTASYSTVDGWYTAIDQGLYVITAGAVGDGNLITTLSGTNTQYNQCAVTASYRLVCDSAAGAQASAGVIAAASDSNNFVMAQAKLKVVASGSYITDFEIWQKIAGVYNLRKAVQGVLVPVDAPSMRLDIRLLGLQVNSTTYLWRLIVNDTDVDCIWQQTVSAGQPTGKIGLHSLLAGVQADEQAYVDQLAFLSRTNIFQPGNIQTGAVVINQALAYAAPLTLMETAITSESYYMRMTHMPGLNNDIVDFGQTPVNLGPPTQAVIIQTGTTSHPAPAGLPPGVYTVVYAWVNAQGESPPGPESASVTAISGTSINTISRAAGPAIPVPAGVTSVRYYFGPGSTFPNTLAAEVTVTSYSDVPGFVASAYTTNGKSPASYISNDLTKTVHFKVPFNLLNPKLEPNDQYFATSLTMQGHASPDGQGSHHRIQIAAAQQSGLKHKIIQAANVTARTALVKAAKESLRLGSRTLTGAKTMTVIRDPIYAGNTPTGMMFRELDTILISAPELYLNGASAIIMGYTMRENDPTMDLILDQHPFGSLGALKRVQLSGGTSF